MPLGRYLSLCATPYLLVQKRLSRRGIAAQLRGFLNDIRRKGPEARTSRQELARGGLDEYGIPID